MSSNSEVIPSHTSRELWTSATSTESTEPAGHLANSKALSVIGLFCEEGLKILNRPQSIKKILLTPWEVQIHILKHK